MMTLKQNWLSILGVLSLVAIHSGRTAEAAECGAQPLPTRSVTLKWQASAESTPGESLIVDFRVDGAPSVPARILQVHASPHFKDSGKISPKKGTSGDLQSFDQKGKYTFQVPVSATLEEQKITVLSVLFGKPYARLKLQYSLEWVTDAGVPQVIEAELDVNRKGIVDTETHQILF